MPAPRIADRISLHRPHPTLSRGPNRHHIVAVFPLFQPSLARWYSAPMGVASSHDLSPRVRCRPPRTLFLTTGTVVFNRLIPPPSLSLSLSLFPFPMRYRPCGTVRSRQSSPIPLMVSPCIPSPRCPIAAPTSNPRGGGSKSCAGRPFPSLRSHLRWPGPPLSSTCELGRFGGLRWMYAVVVLPLFSVLTGNSPRPACFLSGESAAPDTGRARHGGHVGGRDRGQAEDR